MTDIKAAFLGLIILALAQLIQAVWIYTLAQRIRELQADSEEGAVE